jgi:sugar phosphate isomerase/epimerase
MAGQTRREFLGRSAAVMVAAGTMLDVRAMMASPFGLPLGLQLYSVRELLPTDYEGTLKQVAALGYREVEAAGFYKHPVDEVKQDMKAAGLRCVSGHYPSAELHARMDEILAFHTSLEAEYIICSSPGHKDQAAQAGGGHGAPLTIDDWRWNADEFNMFGKKVKAAGLRFGYHNHVAEFQPVDGAVPYDDLLTLTDPALVTMEMDCGWVKVGGGDPVAYLRKYPTRISMLHVKDFKPKDASAGADDRPKAAELGQGTMDYRVIFAAANKGQIKHCFVEQEAFNMAPMESLKVDAEYMKRLTV